MTSHTDAALAFIAALAKKLKSETSAVGRSGDGTGWAALVSVLELVEAERARIRGVDLPWPTGVDLSYRWALVRVEEQIRSIAAQNVPPREIVTKLMQALEHLLAARDAIRHEKV